MVRRPLLAWLVLAAPPLAIAQGGVNAGSGEFFRRLDQNRDGQLSRIEARLGGIDGDFAGMDGDGDGRVSQSEFDAAKPDGALSDSRPGRLTEWPSY